MSPGSVDEDLASAEPNNVGSRGDDLSSPSKSKQDEKVALFPAVRDDAESVTAKSSNDNDPEATDAEDDRHASDSAAKVADLESPLEAYIVPSKPEREVFEAAIYEDPTAQFKVYTKIAWAVGCLLFVGIVITISFILTRPTGGGAVSTAPTLSPLELHATAILSPVMDVAFRHNVIAAQEAFDWLLKDDKSGILEDMKTPDWRIIQRYVVAFVFYTLGGKNGWTHLVFRDYRPSDYFLNTTNECDWHTTLPYYWSPYDPFPVNERGNITHAGTACNIEGRISQLRLAQLNLTGRIPYEVIGFFLPDLESLDFANCIRLSDQLLGSELGLLTNLNSLTILGSNHRGSIPTELGRLTDLYAADLNANLLSGSIPTEIGTWTSMRGARVHANNLTGTIPSELGLWTSMDAFSVFGNQLTGSIPSELGSWTSIREARFHSNGLTGTLPSELGFWTSIEDFDVSGNKLTGSIPSELGSWTSITNAQLLNNTLAGTIPSELGFWTSIENFHVASNHFVGSIPSELGSWTSIRRGQFDNNSLSGTLPSELGLWSLVEIFGVSENKIVGPIPPDLLKWGRINIATFANNSLTGSIPSDLGLCTSIQHFSVADNELEGTLPSQLGNWTKVKLAFFHQNNITGSIPLTFSAWDLAENITVPANLINGTLPVELLGLPIMGVESPPAANIDCSGIICL